MILKMRQSYIFPNYGNSHELNLSIMAMIFKSRKIESNLPPSSASVEDLALKFDEYFKGPFVGIVKELWNVADGLGLMYPYIRAEIHIFPGQYKIVFHCYGD